MTTVFDRMSAIELRCRRKALGLSREALAARLDVRYSTVAKWESERTHVPEGVRADLEVLEDALDAQIAIYLRTGADSRRIALGSDEIESGMHQVAAAHAAFSLRQAGMSVSIAADGQASERTWSRTCHHAVYGYAL